MTDTCRASGRAALGSFFILFKLIILLLHYGWFSTNRFQQAAEKRADLSARPNKTADK